MEQSHSISQYQTRRLALMQSMQSLTHGGIAIIHTASEIKRNADNDFAFRYDSHFYYLTGFNEPEAVLVLLADSKQSILFCREKNLEREIWDGYRYGPAAAKEVFGFDACYPIELFEQKLTALLANQPAAYIQIGLDTADHSLRKGINTLKTQIRMGLVPPSQIRDVTQLISEMRIIKDVHELSIMQHAADISAAAHVRAMQTCKVGQREYHIEAELLHAFRSAGSESVAYGSIVAAGGNSCVLHYRAGNTELKDGDVLLIDAGCELNGYASDITRTFPVNGRFAGEQRAVYEVVLAAQTACFQALAPGKLFNEYHDAATRVLAQGMLDLGLLQGSLDSVLETQSYMQFYMHRAGHWLGLDVHDCGDYREPNSVGETRPWRKLESGMVLTVEPGLYIRPADNVDPRFWNIGVRIEDDAVITDHGYHITTRGVPVQIDEIEALMRG